MSEPTARELISDAGGMFYGEDRRLVLEQALALLADDSSTEGAELTAIAWRCSRNRIAGTCRQRARRSISRPNVAPH
jgi:hypothetical protein